MEDQPEKVVLAWGIWSCMTTIRGNPCATPIPLHSATCMMIYDHKGTHSVNLAMELLAILVDVELITSHCSRL